MGQDVQRELNERQVSIGEFVIPAGVLGSVLKQIVASDITVKSGREIFSDLLSGADNGEPVSTARVDEIIASKGLKVEQNTDKIVQAIDAVIARNEKAAEDVRAGKLQAVGPLIGQVMGQLKGADAKAVRQMIIDRLQS